MRPQHLIALGLATAALVTACSSRGDSVGPAATVAATSAVATAPSVSSPSAEAAAMRVCAAGSRRVAGVSTV